MSYRVLGLGAAAALAIVPFLGAAARADDAGLAQRVEALSKEVSDLKAQAADAQPAEAPKPRWFEFGGDLQVRHDMLRGQVPTYTQVVPTNSGPTMVQSQAHTVANDSLLTNRLGLNSLVQPMEGVSLHLRLLAYKIWGMEDGGATQANFFGDRQNVAFDGTSGHVPQDNIVRVDEAYATIKDIAGYPVWFSAGRRPSTGGVPTNVREDREVSGAAGIPGLLVDYAFDGATLGAAPEIAQLPGFAAKLCYGRAFESGYTQSGSPAAAPHDTNMLGVSVLALETPDARVDVQYQRGFGIFDSIPGPGVKANLGDIEEFGGSLLRTFRDLGPGDLTLFGSGALSEALPNGNRYNAGFGAGNPGLLCDGADCAPKDGYGLYVGGRYDYAKTKTKVGAEFNHGSQDWISFVPAGDDMWTSKLGTRGEVYELYAIQDLGRAPLARDGRVLFRLGWQYYDFRYTGTNSWLGAPKRLSELTLAQAQFMPPIRNAYDVYTTFEVRF